MSEYLTDLNIADYKILQDTDDYAFSQDSVFLANLAQITANDRILDLGCGSGILATLALIKKNAAYALGIELQPRVADMAIRSAKLNGLDNKLDIICGDVKNIRALVKAESFDKVLCNPPYFTNGLLRQTNDAEGNSSNTYKADDDNINEPSKSCDKQDRRAFARCESSATLADFVQAAAFGLRFGGDCYFIVKVDRMAELIYCLKSCSLEPKRLTLIYPKLSKGIDTVIVCARKGAKVGLVTDTFIVADEQGNYTLRAKELYR